MSTDVGGLRREHCRGVTRQQMTFFATGAYLWVVMLLLGGIAQETFMIYPDIFADPPNSIELAKQFFLPHPPSAYFRPFGLACWVTGAGALLLGWSARSSRLWILASVAMIGAEGVWSMVFAWPRNAVLFEGVALHPVEVILQTAQEFQSLHWARVVFNTAAAVFAFVGFLRLYGDRQLARVAGTQAPVGRTAAP